VPTFKTGAFAQQCYSSHPLSLTFKTLTATPQPPPRADAALSRGPIPAETVPFPGPPLLPDAETAPTPGLPEYRVVITCDNCDMRHRFVIRTLISRLGEENEADAEAINRLSRCAAEHPAALRVSGMDISRDTVMLKCGECRRSYALGLSMTETYRK
jgi:hypothetical protein